MCDAMMSFGNLPPRRRHHCSSTTSPTRAVMAQEMSAASAMVRDYSELVLHGELQDGVLSSALPLLANISYRLNRELKEAKGELKLAKKMLKALAAKASPDPFNQLPPIKGLDT